jgi:hypothetical protein
MVRQDIVRCISPVLRDLTAAILRVAKEPLAPAKEVEPVHPLSVHCHEAWQKAMGDVVLIDIRRSFQPYTPPA